MDSWGGAEEVMGSEEKWSNVRSHGLWKQGTTTLFDIHIVNLDARYCLCMPSEELCEKAEKKKKL